jgi:histidine triad (HIT) family protein
MEGIVQVGRAIWKALSPDGMNLISSSGEAAQQTVFHLHFHLVPRRLGDRIGNIWPPDRPIDEEVKENLADLIRSACSSL